MSTLAPAAPLRILWVDDDHEDDVRGFGEDLGEDGHTVHFTEEIDEAERRLAAHPYDLIILDQRIGLDHYAGTSLIKRLKQGDLGDVNSETWFMFFSGSREWVLNAEVNVEALQGCLGIEEKGQVLEDFLELNLERIVPNPLEREPEPEDAMAGTEPGPVRHVTSPEVWSGTVIEVDDDAQHFIVHFTSDGDRALEYEATLPFTRVASKASQSIDLGALVRLEIRTSDDTATRRVVSELTLQPAPDPDLDSRTEALRLARERWNSQ